MADIANYYIDYPEAREAWRHIESERGVSLAGKFERIGGQMSVPKMPKRQFDGSPFIVINGSGNYHHESLPLLHGYLEQTDAPSIAYIQIDAHPDKDPGYRWMIGCASFVGKVMEHPRVETVHLLGLYQPALLFEDYHTNYTRKFGYYQCAYFEKLHEYLAERCSKPEVFFDVYPEAVDDARANPSTRRVRTMDEVPPGEDNPVPAMAVHWRALDEFDPTQLPDLPVYLTIDLDVCRNKPVTDWKLAEGKAGKNRWGVADNQGVLPWRDLIKLVRKIGKHRRIEGADVCGLTEELRRIKPKALEMSLGAMLEIYDAMSDAIAAGGRG